MPAKRTIPSVCAHCGADFLARPDHVKIGRGRFCSYACSSASTMRRVDRTCGICANVFSAHLSEVAYGKGLYCSKACANAALVKSSPEDRFWSYVNKTDTCWIWTGATQSFGYGVFWDSGSTTAHRTALELALGCPIPDGFGALHTCDVPGCVRNDDQGIYVVRGISRPRFGHLWIGTAADNTADMVAKGRCRQPRQH